MDTRYPAAYIRDNSAITRLAEDYLCRLTLLCILLTR